MSNVTNVSSVPKTSRLMLTVGLCFLVALMEGLDLQAAGIAAVGIAQAFGLDKMQMGWIFSAGILGLLPGALGGGMLADRYGRKKVLLGPDGAVWPVFNCDRAGMGFSLAGICSFDDGCRAWCGAAKPDCPDV